LNPFKIQGIFKFEFVPEFVHEILGEFDDVPKIKVIPYVSIYCSTKFGEFWTLGRPLFWISKFKRLKILEIQI
jgi:hypothetical protein